MPCPTLRPVGLLTLENYRAWNLVHVSYFAFTMAGPTGLAKEVSEECRVCQGVFELNWVNKRSDIGQIQGIKNACGMVKEGK